MKSAIIASKLRRGGGLHWSFKTYSSVIKFYTSGACWLWGFSTECFIINKVY